MKNPKSSTSWESVADWYTHYLSQPGTIQQTIIFPRVLRLLDPQAKKHYLDLACGEGAFAVLLAQQGAEVTGIDASPALLRKAKQRALKQAHFIAGDAKRFAHQFSPATFDGMVCILALQNIDPLPALLKDAARVLKNQGAFVFVINHPCFRQPRQSGWGWDEARKLQYRRIDRYLQSYTMPIFTHPGSAPCLKTFSFHRPLQSYVQDLSTHGFMIDAVEEWTSDKCSASGPRAKAENIARAEIPLFLAIRARKIAAP